MADFITRLFERSFGLLETVQPVLPSRFEHPSYDELPSASPPAIEAGSYQKVSHPEEIPDARPVTEKMYGENNKDPQKPDSARLSPILTEDEPNIEKPSIFPLTEKVTHQQHLVHSESSTDKEPATTNMRDLKSTARPSLRSKYTSDERSMLSKQTVASVPSTELRDSDTDEDSTISSGRRAIRPIVRLHHNEEKQQITNHRSNAISKTSNADAKTSLLPIDRAKTIRNDVSSAETHSSHEPRSIKVTIGCVDVKAIMQQTPQPRPAKPLSPKLSLDEYLKSRNGGQH